MGLFYNYILDINITFNFFISFIEYELQIYLIVQKRTNVFKTQVCHRRCLYMVFIHFGFLLLDGCVCTVKILTHA